ncbi:tyrosine-protein phosphatase non-receptor type 9-like [Cydia pomonella]|uniref:tyrosine-protein phosphatase non-receptor type 9-like n=1 Tax=Cydia pomonella TaxID=82600 RepID=UPI002ADD5418|nr:tyrosine-protein phosphatase non-receptor type 9-like [Cydia pomonella]
MEKFVLPMNGNDFLLFMSKRNSLTSVIAEYHSIVPMRKEKLLKTSIQDENESENEGDIQFERHLYRWVKLKSKETVFGATFVDGYEIERKYICTKSRQDVYGNFWEIVWKYKVQVIVMMDQFSDKESNQNLFPDEGCVTVCDKFKIKTLEIRVKPHYKLTLLSLTDQSGNEHKISHCQYTAWPRDNFSHQLDAFIDFYWNVRDLCLQLEKQADKKTAPMILQCLDGHSSSAVFCVFDICVAEFEKTGTLCVSSVLKKVRQQKYGFMNRLENYTLCYELLSAYVEKKLSPITS